MCDNIIMKWGAGMRVKDQKAIEIYQN
jgi:hypothetical protein